MNGCSAIQFLNEIKNVLKEKRQLQIELGYFNEQNNELNVFLDKIYLNK